MNRDQFLAAALRNPANQLIADELFRLALPDAWIVAGCLVQTVWNVLTDRAVDYGIGVWVPARAEPVIGRAFARPVGLAGTTEITAPRRT